MDVKDMKIDGRDHIIIKNIRKLIFNLIRDNHSTQCRPMSNEERNK